MSRGILLVNGRVTFRWGRRVLIQGVEKDFHFEPGSVPTHYFNQMNSPNKSLLINSPSHPIVVFIFHANSLLVGTRRGKKLKEDERAGPSSPSSCLVSSYELTSYLLLTSSDSLLMNPSKGITFDPLEKDPSNPKKSITISIKLAHSRKCQVKDSSFQFQVTYNYY